MQYADILNLAGLRHDGRKANELRELKHNLGVGPYGDGSCYFEQGLNKVLVVVNAYTSNGIFTALQKATQCIN